MTDIYQQQWNPKEYLKQYYCTDHVEDDELENFKFLSTFLQTTEKSFQRCLDFGCGCTLHHMMPLAPYVSEIHLADYMASNLEEIQDWLDESPTAHDWDVYFRGVLDLEGRDLVSEESLAKRKSELRGKITSLELANIRNKLPLGKNVAYELVTSYYCADAVASSKEEWKTMIDNLSTLVAPGGTLVMSVMRHCNFYKIGDKQFPAAYVDETDIAHVLRHNGFDMEKSDIQAVQVDDWAEEGFNGICLVRAEKQA